jgi:glycine dehydrogenase subunit 1
MVCQLTGMEVANASLYDGSTALAEAALMALRLNRGRTKIVVASSVHPHYRSVVATYLESLGAELVEAPVGEDGRISSDGLGIDANTAAVLVQSPNFLGCVEDLDAIGASAKAAGALFVVAVAEATSLGLLRAPGDAGADIVCGEAQAFGVPISFGGPYVGMFATREKYLRQMPGRLVGRAADANGNRGFVLTLSTREQHIRREKATSNICTNQGLFMLIATIWLSAMGRTGLREIAEQNLRKAHYAAKRIAALDGYSLPYSAPFYNEFVVTTPKPARELRDRVYEHSGVVAGVPLDRYYPEMRNALLVCVTETATRDRIDALVAGLEEAAK